MCAKGRTAAELPAVRNQGWARRMCWIESRIVEPQKSKVAGSEMTPILGARDPAGAALGSTLARLGTYLGREVPLLTCSVFFQPDIDLTHSVAKYTPTLVY
jgi:hypothetical protein